MAALASATLSLIFFALGERKLLEAVGEEETGSAGLLNRFQGDAREISDPRGLFDVAMTAADCRL